MGRVTSREVLQMKARGEKIPMVTVYDYTAARLADQAGIPLLLVGDSLGMVMLGHETTVPVTVEDMLHHVKAVARGAGHAMVVADLPFMSYHVDHAQTMANAARLVQEGGAHSLKLEGGVKVADTVDRMVQAGIPVMGHIGLTPQSVNVLGGYRVEGRNKEEAVRLLKDALALERAGAYALVLELVPAPLAGAISQRLAIPTIGIGAGPQCDGQVQVFHDMLGLFTDFIPKHAKRYANLAETIQDAFARYAQEVKEVSFPTRQQSISMDETILEELMTVQ